MVKVCTFMERKARLWTESSTEEDPLDRELQSTELAKIMAASTRPVLFLGYVVTKPLENRRKYSLSLTYRNSRLFQRALMVSSSTRVMFTTLTWKIWIDGKHTFHPNVAVLKHRTGVNISCIVVSTGHHMLDFREEL